MKLDPGIHIGSTWFSSENRVWQFLKICYQEKKFRQKGMNYKVVTLDEITIVV
jgi:hypothetical protein